MADERTLIDANQEHTIAGVTYDASEDIMNVTLNPVDKRLRVDSSITSIADGFELGPYDYIGATYPDATTEVYTFKTGGSGGTTVGTLTVVFTDSSKEVLTSVTKT